MVSRTVKAFRKALPAGKLPIAILLLDAMSIRQDLAFNVHRMCAHACEQSMLCFETSTGQVVGFAELGDLDDAILEWEAGDALAGVPGANKPLACEASIRCPLV